LWTRSSAASVWEIAVKASLGKLTLATTLEQLVRGGIERGVRLLDVTAGHAYRVEQAMHEGMVIVSRDGQLDEYPVTRIWR